MPDLLPDIPSDLWNNWSADQFAQAAQDKIASLPGDIATGAQNLLAPPAPPPAPAPPAAPPPTPEPAPPPPPPEPAAPPPPAPDQATDQAPEAAPAAPDIAPAPTDVPPDLSTPAPAPSPAPAPDLSAPAAPPAPGPTASSSGFDPFGMALGAADAAGADVGQFAQNFGTMLDQSGGDVMLAGINAASMAGGDAQQFASNFNDAFSQVAQPVQQAAQQTPQLAAQSLGIQGPTPNQAGDFIDQARQAATTAGIDPDIFARQIQQESGFNPNAKSGAGAIGIAQFMPGTAQGMGIDPTDPVASLKAAAQMDAQNLQKYGGDWSDALAAYNAGGGNVDKYGGVPPFAETQSYVSNILGGAKNVVQQAATQGATAVNDASQAAQSAVARTSQFALGLSSGDAMAFCGPAAALAFAQTYGRNPTVDEAKQLAQQVGWSPDQGMAGPSSEVSLLNALGIQSHMTQGVDWSTVASDASSGNPVIIDTPGHYFYVQGYNAQTGQFNLGSSATDLKAAKGQEWFSPDQIANLGMGDPRAAIFADHPLSGAGAAVQQAASGAQNLLSDVGSGAQGALQKAQDTMGAVLDTGLSTLQNNPAAQWLGSQGQNAGQDAQGAAGGAQDLISQLLGGGQGPTDQSDADARWAAAQQAAQQQTGSTVDLPTNPLDALSNMSQYGIGQAGQQLTDLRNQLIAQNNPLRDVPVLGGLSTMLGQSTIGDPTNLLLGAGPELGLAATDVAKGAGGAALGGGLSLLDMLSSPEIAYATTRQAGESAEDYLTRMATTAPEDLLPGHAGNAAASTYSSAVQSNIAPATGAGLLQHAMDALSQYPDEVADPIRNFASGIAGTGENQAPASEVASTIQRWMLDNPLSSVPDPITGPTQLARDAGQQAVADIADAVSSGRRSAFPPGSIPDLLAQSSAQGQSQPVADLVDSLLGGGQQRNLGVRSTAGYLPPGVMPGQETLPLTEGTDLFNQVGQTADPAQSAWLQQALSRSSAQPGLPTSGQGGQLDELLSQLEPGTARAGPYQPQQTLGTFQMPFAQAAQGGTLDDFLNSLYQNQTPAQSLPKGVTQDMVSAAHARIDQIGNQAGFGKQTPHADLNSMLANNADPAQISRFFGALEGKSPWSWSDVLQQLRTGSMAGGLNTEGKVALTPLIQAAMRAPTGALNLMLQGRADEIPAGLMGGLSGLGSGAEEALQTLRYGTNYRTALTGSAGGGFGFDPGMDVMGSNAFQRALGTALTGLVRTHGAIGDISAGIGRGANTALGATPAEALEAGQQWALRSGEYGRTGAAIQRAISGIRKVNPALDVLGQIAMPFYRAGYNVFTQGVEHSPLGLAGRVSDALEGKPFDQGKLVNNLFGVGVAGLALKEAADGNITGDRPPPGAPKQSVRIGGQWVPLHVLGAASEPLAQAAALHEAARDNKGDIKGLATQMGSEYVSHVTDETWLGSMADFFNTLGDVRNLSNPTQAPLASRDLGYIGGQYAKSFIPQEKLGEQAGQALSWLKSRSAPARSPTPPAAPGAVRPAPTIRPASTVRAAPTPRSAPASR